MTSVTREAFSITPLPRCSVGVYVRHGDKDIEMQLLPVETYLKTVSQVLDMMNGHQDTDYLRPESSGHSHDSSTDRGTTTLWNFTDPILQNSVFIGTEDPDVLTAAVQWGVENNVVVYYTNLFDRATDVTAGLNFKLQREIRLGRVASSTITTSAPSGTSPLNASAGTSEGDILTAWRTRQQAVERPQSSASSGHYLTHHPLEYLSMIINLHVLLTCEAWVCTLRSNYCRLVDELRATVGGKADGIYADLSIETCASPPCIGGANITGFDWRRIR